jgi:hypothetical protein
VVSRRYAPSSFNLAAELIRVSGVDALRIDGINLITFQTVVAEMGTDLGSWFPTEYHFASWLGLTPRRDVSGGKVIRHTREKSRNRVAGVLRMAANALLRSDSYLGARYRSLRTRLGSPKAIKAMARYLACILYRLFTRSGMGGSRSRTLRAKPPNTRSGQAAGPGQLARIPPRPPPVNRHASTWNSSLPTY